MGRSDEEFLRVGDEIVDAMTELAGLARDASVLDIGCGYGRVAHALLRRGHTGPYSGIDILPPHIVWCEQHLTPFTHGRYRFRHADVRNARYNPGGTIDPTRVTLAAGEPVDFVLAASVFTHMYRPEVEHYLSEIRSALRPGGRAMVTFFLMNESQAALEASGQSRYPLQIEVDAVSRCWSRDDPLHVIGFGQDWVEQRLDQVDLIVESVHLGAWCGRADARVYQDTLILTRP